MAVLFALIALVGWGAGDIFVTIVSRKIGNRMALFIWLVIGFLISTLYLPFAGPISDYSMFLIAVILNIFGIAGTVLYLNALEIGNASLVGTISGAFPVITVPLSIVLFKEFLNPIQFLAIMVIIFGLILTTFHPDDLKSRSLSRLINDKSIVYSLITLIVWGIYWALMRYPVEKIGWYWSGYSGYFFILVVLIFKMVKKIPIRKLLNLKMLIFAFCMSLLTTLASFSYNLGISYGYTSIVAPIAGSSPVLFVILSRFVFKEPLTNQQKAGIFFALLGIVLIGVSSV